ncbi:MAG: PAS domain-containing protein, partial [Verrucomicrobia bacterium]|nr:PAS domain-containing protein [Verrucomicrobiota bacterium]
MVDVRTGQNLFVSTAYEEIWGRTCESLYTDPQSWLESIHPDDREEVRQATMRGTKGGFDVEYRILRPDGTTRWIQDRGFPVRNASGVVYRVAGVAQDISDRRRAESEIAERLSLEQQLSKLTATAPGAIISFQRMPDGSTRLPYASARLKEIVGLDPAEVAHDARAAFQLVHPDDLQPLLDAIEASAQTLSPCTSIFRVHNPLKGLVWVEASAIPTREPDESILWHGFLLNITERKKAETERARLATAAEQAAEAIVITDTAGNIQYVNPAFELVSGYTRAEVEGRNPRLLKSGEQDDAFYRGLWETLSRGQVWRGHLKNKRKDGTLFDEEATISPVHDDTGQVVNYVAVKRDVSHERQVEEQFRQAQKMEAIGRLAGGVAHDFNNLLAVISAHLELLDMRDGLLTKHQESVGEIRKAADRAAALTHQLLLFSRRQAVQRRTIDLNEVVTSMTKMLRRILGEDIRLRFSYASSALLVDADAGMMDQILLNLAVNARDAMPRGGEMILETSEVDFPEVIGGQKPLGRTG